MCSREYCEDRTERMWSFREARTRSRPPTRLQLEDAGASSGPWRRDWYQRRACHDIQTLPDELSQAGVSWKYYLG